MATPKSINVVMSATQAALAALYPAILTNIDAPPMDSGVVVNAAHILTVKLSRELVGEAVTWLCGNVGEFSIHDHTTKAFHNGAVVSQMTIEFESHADAAKFKLLFANGS